jgi:16S rRNA (cytosine1402-N4)-methyltransferase
MSADNLTYHVPVMLRESVDAMNIGNGVYADMTFGGGGHSREMLARMGAKARLFGFDQDTDTLANVPDDARFTFVLSNFRYLRNWMNYYGIEAVDGIMADLGVSSHHFDAAERGFTFRSDAPLDMRMNRTAKLTAADFLNTADEERIAAVLRNYGELRNARRMAAAIVKRRAARPLATTTQFVETIEPFVGRDKEKRKLACAFQALRIEINDEMGALREMLASAISLLAKGGRLVVLTYHSLEDRMVKNFLKSGNAEGKVEQDFFGNRMVPLRAVNSHVIVPSPEEIERNPRSRSAKLRVAEKV